MKTLDLRTQPMKTLDLSTANENIGFEYKYRAMTLSLSRYLRKVNKFTYIFNEIL